MKTSLEMLVQLTVETEIAEVLFVNRIIFVITIMIEIR